MKPFPRSFYLEPTLQVARNLLGAYFIRRIRTTLVIGKIVEVEAYRRNDPASHSFRGKTPRNRMMFCGGGHLYVYFTYGMHFCANVVTGEEETGEAVLIRAVEPLVGIEWMIKNRYHDTPASGIQPITPAFLMNLTNGPAKFCQAFGITKTQNGSDLVEPGPLFICPREKISSSAVGSSPRIGITTGREKRWRYFIKNNPWVRKTNPSI